MGKSKSFADKMNKSTHDFSTHCEKCGESIQPAKVVQMEKSDKTSAYRFKEGFVGLCKCNQDSIGK